MKCKVKSYVHLHHLKDNVNNLKNLVALILSDDLDDLISQFQDDPETIKRIEETQEVVSKQFNHLVVEFKKLRGDYFYKFRENRKNFALKNSKKPLFGGVMKTLNTSMRDIEKNAEEQVTLYILKQTNTLTKATEWVESL